MYALLNSNYVFNNYKLFERDQNYPLIVKCSGFDVVSLETALERFDEFHIKARNSSNLKVLERKRFQILRPCQKLISPRRIIRFIRYSSLAHK